MSDDNPGGSGDGSASDDSAHDSDAPANAATEQDGTAGSAPTEPTEPEPSDRGDPAPDDGAPLSDLARRMNRQRRDQTDEGSAEPTPGLDIDTDLSDAPPDPDDDPFERMSVAEIDDETLWSSLGDDDVADVGVDATPEADVGPLADVDPVDEVESVGDAGPEAREHVVPKKKYCQSCPYLDEPPELACTHEGTEIVEVVDSERFRVRNCPMVEGGVEPTE